MRYEKIASSWDQSTDDAWASIQYNKGTQSVGQKVKHLCKIQFLKLKNLVYLQKQTQTGDFGQFTTLPWYQLSRAILPSRVPVRHKTLLTRAYKFRNQPSIDDDIFATKIGKGIGLVNVKGQIFVDNLTKGSIFSQSWTGTEYVNKVNSKNIKEDNRFSAIRRQSSSLDNNGNQGWTCGGLCLRLGNFCKRSWCETMSVNYIWEKQDDLGVCTKTAKSKRWKQSRSWKTR